VGHIRSQLDSDRIDTVKTDVTFHTTWLGTPRLARGGVSVARPAISRMGSNPELTWIARWSRCASASCRAAGSGYRATRAVTVKSRTADSPRPSRRTINTEYVRCFVGFACTLPHGRSSPPQPRGGGHRDQQTRRRRDRTVTLLPDQTCGERRGARHPSRRARNVVSDT
jgi:hypothetical protein